MMRKKYFVETTSADKRHRVWHYLASSGVQYVISLTISSEGDTFSVGAVVKNGTKVSPVILGLKKMLDKEFGDGQGGSGEMDETHDVSSGAYRFTMTVRPAGQP